MLFPKNSSIDDGVIHHEEKVKVKVRPLNLMGGGKVANTEIGYAASPSRKMLRDVKNVIFNIR